MVENELKSEKSMIVKIIQLFPLFGAAFIMFGIARLMGYYDRFDIPIVHFLDFSEIVTSFLDTLVFAGLFILGGIVGFLIPQRSIKQIKLLEDAVRSATNEKVIQKVIDLQEKFRRQTLIISVGLLLLTAIITVLYFFGVVFPVFFWSHIVFVSILLALNWNATRRYNELIENLRFLERFIVKSALMVFLSFYLFYLIGMFQGFYVIQTHRYKNVKIYLNDKNMLVSNDDSSYIGNTRNYLFYYHYNTKTSKAIPMSRVDEINFKLN